MGIEVWDALVSFLINKQWSWDCFIYNQRGLCEARPRLRCMWGNEALRMFKRGTLFCIYAVCNKSGLQQKCMETAKSNAWPFKDLLLWLAPGCLGTCIWRAYPPLLELVSASPVSRLCMVWFYPSHLLSSWESGIQMWGRGDCIIKR